jgi:uncharacterized membrane protein YhhN
MKKEIIALSLFFAAAVIHLTGIVLQWHDGDITFKAVLFLSKCLLMPALALYAHFSFQDKTEPYHRFILPALIFSWMGDVLLTWKEPIYFLAGLSAFLVGHIFYMLTYFNETRYKNFNLVKTKPYLIAPYAIVVIFFLSKTYLNLNWFIIPVAIYSMVLESMSLFALNRFNNVNIKSFVLTYIGSLSFMFSDFLIGWTVFYQDIEYSRLIIMITYIGGQFLIIHGLVKRQEVV